MLGRQHDVVDTCSDVGHRSAWGFIGNPDRYVVMDAKRHARGDEKHTRENEIAPKGFSRFSRQVFVHYGMPTSSHLPDAPAAPG